MYSLGWTGLTKRQEREGMCELHREYNWWMLQRFVGRRWSSDLCSLYVRVSIYFDIIHPPDLAICQPGVSGRINYYPNAGLSLVHFPLNE